MSIRKILSFALCVAMLFTVMTSLTACNVVEEETPDPTDAPTTTSTPTTKPTAVPTTKVTKKPSPSNNDNNTTVDENDVTAFDLDKFLYPVWADNISYAEAAFVRENENGGIDPIQLLYPIDEIVSVRSADLKTLYKNGEDYTIEDGKLVILSEGKIPVLAYDDFCFELTTENYDNNATKLPAVDKPGYGYIRAEIGANKPGMSAWTLAVTYTHSTESVVTVPETKSLVFKNLLNKIAKGEEVKIVSTGDSITYGWSASGTVGLEPKCPQYNLLVEQFIEKNYGIPVTQTNVGVSGSTSSGGVSKLNEICAEKPDLVIIAFGMNDGGGVTPSAFVNNINTMVSTIERNCPEAVIVVVGTALPNEKIAWSIGGSPALNYHDDYPEALMEAEEEWKNAAFANVTQANIDLYARKVYEDLAGSNSNHPNDYMHRIYAQVILKTIFGEYYV